jgi:hypothetical protein
MMLSPAALLVVVRAEEIVRRWLREDRRLPETRVRPAPSSQFVGAVVGAVVTATATPSISNDLLPATEAHVHEW